MDKSYGAARFIKQFTRNDRDHYKGNINDMIHVEGVMKQEICEGLNETIPIYGCVVCRGRSGCVQTGKCMLGQFEYNLNHWRKEVTTILFSVYKFAN